MTPATPTTPTSDNELLTVPQVAGILQMHNETIRRLIREGKIPAEKLGHRTVRVRRRDVEAMVDTHETARVHLPGTEAGTDRNQARVIAGVKAELERIARTIEGIDADSKPHEQGNALSGIAERLTALAARLGRIDPGGQALSVGEAPAEYGENETEPDRDRH